MFCDETEVTFIAGKGGDGMVSFRREKYVPRGGPDGGNGGHGGNIILRSTTRVNTLSIFLRDKLFRAEAGKKGQRYLKAGKSGADLLLDVPVGTMIFDKESNELIVDLNEPNLEYVIARGGKGGFGNAHFASSVRQAPQFAEKGDQGEEKMCRLELKLVADVGIVGLPSVGKSTLISRISRARPKIAAYPFTTLVPNLGVVDLMNYGAEKGTSFVIADMPGLIRGACEGKGLGDQFLKHIARTRVLIHLLDGTSSDLISDFQTICSELETFDPDLLKKKQIVAINKIDIMTETQTKTAFDLLKNNFSHSLPLFCISAVTGKGLKELLFEVWRIVQQENASLNKVQITLPVEKIYRPLEDDFHHFHIRRKKKGMFVLTGKRIEQIVRMTNIENDQAIARVYDILSKMKILSALAQEGAQPGDTIIIAGQKFEYLGK